MSITREAPQRASARDRHSSARAILWIVLVSYFLILLNNSIIFTGLPRIRADLGLSAAGAAWTQNAFTLVFGGLLLLGARAGDLLGRGRVFLAGLAVFGPASALVGVSRSEAWIIVFRGLQGLGAAVVAPSSLALITAVFPPGPQRTRAIAAYGTTAGLGSSLGLVLGGALASWLSWRAGFFLNGAVALGLIPIAVRRLPAFPTARGAFDLTGAATSTLGMGGLVYGIIRGGQDGWSSPGTLGPIVAGLALLGVFALVEWRAHQPVLPLRLFASAERSGAAAVRLLFAGTAMAFFWFTSQWFQGVLGWTPLQAGLGFLPLSLVQFGFSLLVPRLTPRVGDAGLVLAGLVHVGLGMVWMTQLEPSQSFLAGMVAPLMLIGAGQGLAFGPMTSVGIVGARPEDSGAASGLVNTAHQLGSTLGIAVLTAVAAGAVGQPAQILAAWRGGVVLLALAVLITAVVILPGRRRRLVRETA